MRDHLDTIVDALVDSTTPRTTRQKLIDWGVDNFWRRADSVAAVVHRATSANRNIPWKGVEMMINWSRVLWDGLPDDDRAALKAGQLDARFPNLKPACMNAIAEDALIDVLADFIYVDTSKTNS